VATHTSTPPERITRHAFSLRTRRLGWICKPEDAFAALFRSSPEAFWLDGETGDHKSRFSFMGDASGPLAETVYYDAGEGLLRVRSTDENGVACERARREPVLDRLARRLGEMCLPADPELPFDFACGFAGFLGYEHGDETGRSLYPDAAFVLADRLIAFDWDERVVWLLELAPDGSEPSGWMDAAEERLRAVERLGPPDPGCAEGRISFAPDLPRDRYQEAVARCRREIERGQSYEICLTTQLRAQLGAADRLDAFELYRVLRRLNPAPYSAFLRFGDLAVLSSSPERFLKLDRGGAIESKPIKGTAPRSADPDEDERLAEALRSSEKNRAENVMIADLMRNDLGRVCAVGSVEVPALAQVESFARVHQLVTTVRGRLRPGLGIVDAVRAAFPPGSMTGAPKISTMRIIEELEPEPRGVYSGCLGYLSLDGCADLSVVIRTIVVRGGELSIGSGGAITALSDADEELAELELKAEPLVRACSSLAGCSPGSGTRPAPAPPRSERD
jgi:para-aminobenzoate synthetase